MVVNKTNVITILVLALIVIVAFVYFINVRDQQVQSDLEESSVAKAFSDDANYTDINGNPISLSSFVGQPVIALAWASWCPACVEQLRTIAEVADQNGNVTVLAINRAEPASTATSFLNAYDISADVTLILDPNDYFFDSIAGFSMPETVIYDESGTVVHHERGPISAEELTFELSAIAERY